MNVLKLNNRKLALLMLRVVTGINYLMHGAVRVLGDYSGFASGMVRDFEDTFLHPLSVKSLAFIIPLAELVIGLILITGYKLKYGVIIGFLLMGILVFGMSLLQQWGVVGTQMIYVLALFLILYFHDDNG